MIDQATELRQRMQAERDALAARRALPSIVTLLGAAPGVGVSTIATQLTSAMQLNNEFTLYRDLATSSAAEMRREAGAATIVVDAGCEVNEVLREVWRLSGLVMLVLPADGTCVLECYRMVKQLHEADCDTELGVLVNMCRLAELAYAPLVDSIQNRLRESARRFLDVAITPFGCIPHQIELENGWQDTAGRRAPSACFVPLAESVTQLLRRRKQTTRGLNRQAQNRTNLEERTQPAPPRIPMK